MKRTVLVMMFCALLAVTPALFAQDKDYNRGEIGVFFDFNRLAHTSTNFYGVGVAWDSTSILTFNLKLKGHTTGIAT